MPDPALITARGWEMLNELPPIVRDDPDYQAVIHAEAKATERLEEHVELTRRQLFPHLAEAMLPAWEATLKLPINPAGQTIAQRQTSVVTMYRRQVTEPGGRAWVALGIFLIGPGWTYEEHIPGDVTTPAANTIRITLPFVVGSPRFVLAARIFRDITPANTALEFLSTEGFILDQSQLDIDTFNP